jgi:hypothetical protein
METGAKVILSAVGYISCLEDEFAVYQHPQIIETSVFALPDPRLGKHLGQLPRLKVLKKLTKIV